MFFHCCDKKEGEGQSENTCVHGAYCKRMVFGIFAVVLTVFVGLKAYNAYLESKYIGKDYTGQNSITVSASGEVFAKPDVAQINVSVEEEGKDLAAAQKIHTEKINRVIKFIKDSGVEEKDIKTSNYSVYPVYDYLRDRGQVLKGYRVSQTLDVKVRKVDDAGKILSGAVENGSNQIGGINFIVDDEDALKREARQKAIKEAKEKAKAIAKDLDVDLSRLVAFNESGDQPIYYKSYDAVAGMGGPESAPAPQVPTGENKITVSVSLTYEIR